MRYLKKVLEIPFERGAVWWGLILFVFLFFFIFLNPMSALRYWILTPFSAVLPLSCHSHDFVDDLSLFHCQFLHFILPFSPTGVSFCFCMDMDMVWTFLPYFLKISIQSKLLIFHLFHYRSLIKFFFYAPVFNSIFSTLAHHFSPIFQKLEFRRFNFNMSSLPTSAMQNHIKICEICKKLKRLTSWVMTDEPSKISAHIASALLSITFVYCNCNESL